MSIEAIRAAEFGFAQHLIAAGRLDQAQDALAALTGTTQPSPEPELARLWRSLGRRCFDAERFALAARAFEQSLILTPGDAAARLDLGFALCNLGLYDQARIAFATIPEQAEEKAAALRGLGVMAIRSGDSGTADGYLVQALRRDPEDAEAWSLRIQIQFNKLEVGRRFRDWTRLNAKDPQARPDFLGLGGEDWAFLENALGNVRRLNPRIRVDEFGYRLLTTAGRPEAALDFLAADPAPDARTSRLMADGCWLLRKPDEARRHYRDSMELRCRGPITQRPLLRQNPLLPERLRKRLESRSRTEEPKGLPLVYVHWDAPDYFQLSLAQSLATNPCSDVVVLGDATNAFEGTAHVTMTDVDAGAREFAKCYRHKGENDYSYELFCFERWFMLRDWMHKSGVERAVSLDSDILLFTDLRNEAARFGEHPAIFAGPGFAVVTLAGIEAYCGWLLTMFREDGLADMDLVSDLSLLTRYLAQGHGVSLSDLGESPFYDAHIRHSEGFVMRHGVKKIDFDETGRPWGTRQEGGGRVPFALLHFQGRTKSLMSPAAEGRAFAPTDFTF